jgi:hypothetical protein
MALAGGGIMEFVAHHTDIDVKGAQERLAAFLEGLKDTFTGSNSDSGATGGTTQTASGAPPNSCSVNDRGSRSVSELRRPTMCTIGDPGTVELAALLRGDEPLWTDGGTPRVAGDPDTSDLGDLSPSASGTGKPGKGDKLALNDSSNPSSNSGGDPLTSPDGDPLPPIVPTAGHGPSGPFPLFQHNPPPPDPNPDPGPQSNPGPLPHFAPTINGPSSLGGGPPPPDNKKHQNQQLTQNSDPQGGAGQPNVTDPPNGNDPPSTPTGNDPPVTVAEPGGLAIFGLSCLTLLALRRRRSGDLAAPI